MAQSDDVTLIGMCAMYHGFNTYLSSIKASHHQGIGPDFLVQAEQHSQAKGQGSHAAVPLIDGLWKAPVPLFGAYKVDDNPNRCKGGIVGSCSRSNNFSVEAGRNTPTSCPRPTLQGREVPYAQAPTMPYSPPNREAFRIDLAKTHEMEADAASSTMCRAPFFSDVSPPLQQ